MKGNLDSDTLKRIESPCGCAAVVEQTEASAGMSMFFCNTHAQGGQGLVYDTKNEILFHDAMGWDYEVCPS